jgi:hypothetical protein
VVTLAEMDTPHDRFARWVAWSTKSRLEIGELLGCSDVFVGLVLNRKRLPGLPTAVALERASADWPDGPIKVGEWEQLYVDAKAKTGTEG